jgi:sulfur carrier protein
MASGLRMNEVHLSVDEHPHRVAAGTTLAELVAGLGHTPEQVGTAVNGVFVPRPSRATHVLQPGDAVLLFQPIVGG